MKQNRNDPEIKAFINTGFAISKPSILTKLRRRDIEWRKFTFIRSYGKHSVIDFIGTYNNYLFMPEKSEQFINHLLTLFYKTNPNPSLQLKIAFTHTLHSNLLLPKTASPQHEKFLSENPQFTHKKDS
ncbi:MAG: hypothetical protein KAS32_17340 [Candidatus Peribacteraceae bacterium]|nr:hypothetical protein [Candidatus Peribacteraceae bacterium]